MIISKKVRHPGPLFSDAERMGYAPTLDAASPIVALMLRGLIVR